MKNPIKSFSGEVELSKSSFSAKARLLKDFTYWDRLGRPHTATRGFATNGMSGKLILLAVIGCSPFGKGIEACVIHDWYWTRAEDLLERKDRLTLRKTADKLFLEMLKVCGFGKIKRRIIYRVVRTASRFYK